MVTAVENLSLSAESFISQLPEPQWGPIGKEIYERTYSRKKANGEQETWRDTVLRVVEGNLKFVPPQFIEKNEREDLIKLLYGFKAIPAGRHLWVTGVPGRQFINNCWNSHWDTQFSRHFTFLFERLMEGGGVGANYSNKYLKQYKPFRRTVDLHFVCNPEHGDYNNLVMRKFDDSEPEPVEIPLLSKDFHHEWTGSTVISDDREGWVAALGAVLDAFHSDGDDPVTIVFDVSIIRKKGSPIRGFGGTASGPQALMEMLRTIVDLLNEHKGQKPDSLLCMMIDHLIASCVIAGNVRRSARMSMKYWLDEDIFEFINCKNGGKTHWSTNISVVVDNKFFKAIKRNDPHALAVLKAIASGMLHNGEPGIYNIDLASKGELGEAFTTNPCGEIAFSSPWEQCNLGHVNLAAFVNDPSGLYKAMRLMARFLIRATYADIPDVEARKVVDRNRRIGVGFFGFHEWAVLQGVRFSESHHNNGIRRQLEKCYEVVRKEARDYAFELRIPEPIKVTSVAPTGSVALLPGTTGGDQAVFSPYFKRRVRFSAVDPTAIAQLKNFEALGYPIEDCVYSKNTKVVTFFVKDPLVEKCEKAGLPIELVEGQYDIHIQDALAVQAMVQEVFADNAVSFTANIIEKDYTVDDIIEAIKIYGPRIKGATVMPDQSNRPQLPFEAITREEWLEATEKMVALDVSQVEMECQNGACPIK